MRRTVITSLLLGASALGLSTFAAATGGAAPPAAAPKPAAPETPAPQVQSVATMLEGFHFGVSHIEVTKVYNQVNGIFDREYNPKLAKMQPGVQMTNLEAERDKRKIQFANSIIEFKETPVFDATGLKGEFAYKNHEFAQISDDPGKRRLFFYMGAPPADRMWKMYIEYKFAGEAPEMGKTYAECVQKIGGTLGAQGRARNPDPDKGLLLPYTEWQDATVHVRAVNRTGEGICGVVFEDLRTFGSLKTLRPTTVDDPMAMDPSVAAITRGGVSDPNAKPGAGGGDAGAPRSGTGNKKK